MLTQEDIAEDELESRESRWEPEDMGAEAGSRVGLEDLLGRGQKWRWIRIRRA